MARSPTLVEVRISLPPGGIPSPLASLSSSASGALMLVESRRGPTATIARGTG